MEIGIKPKGGLNFKAIDWETEGGEYADSEALGTAFFANEGIETCLGPGVSQAGTSRMLTRPEVWQYKDPETGEYGFYSSYAWDYKISDHNGLVEFNVTLDYDLIGDFARIFDESMFSSGSITRDSLDDYRLYVRVIHAPIFDVDDMAFVDGSELYCCNNSNVFDLDRVSELDDYDVSLTQFY
ncbi:unnamed protein product, partial [marine sediment metagenome]